MLTAYDDLPVQQVASTVDHVAAGDPRWFDRYWFIAYDPDGRLALATGLGVYKNTGVIDAFGCGVADGVQRNFRVSRSLRPELSLAAGPISYDVIEGLRRFRLRLETGHSDVSFDLLWTADFDPYEEDHHFVRNGGAVSQDYLRYYQHGTASGTITVGERTVTGNFWSFRDRSFGVRPGMGGPMPRSAGDLSSSDLASSGVGLREQPALFVGGSFSTDKLSGTCSFGEATDGTLLQIDGRFLAKDGRSAEPIVAVEHDLEFSGNGTLHRGELRYRARSGERIAVAFEPLIEPLVYAGFGYGDGWNDRLGLGAYRGDLVTEVDAYDVTDVEHITDLSGHRDFASRPLLDQPFKVLVQDQPGCMETVANLYPAHHRYRADVQGSG